MTQSAGNDILQIPTVAGETYQLQYRDGSSGSWSNVIGASITNSIGGPLTFTNAVTGKSSQRLYRFNITP